jgi:hypothetical protein
MLKVQRFREALEQPFSVAQNDRRDDNGQLVNQAAAGTPATMRDDEERQPLGVLAVADSAA